MNRCEDGERHAVGNDRPMKDQEKRYDEDRYAEKSSRLLFRRRIESPGESRPVVWVINQRRAAIIVSAGSAPRGQSVLQSPQ